MSQRNGKDAYLYLRFLQGDNDAMEELVRVYSDELVRFAYCYVKNADVAEDIMENAFASLIVKRRRFSLKDNVRAYLYKAVRNKSIDYLRAHKKFVPLSDVETVLQGGETETSVLRKECNRAVYRCMQQLPTQYQETLYLAYFEDYGAEEIAKITQKTKKQVYNLLARAKAALKTLLEKEGISYEDV